MMNGAAAHTHGCTSLVPESFMLQHSKDKQLTTFIPILNEYLSDVWSVSYWIWVVIGIIEENIRSSLVSMLSLKKIQEKWHNKRFSRYCDRFGNLLVSFGFFLFWWFGFFFKSREAKLLMATISFSRLLSRFSYNAYEAEYQCLDECMV